MDYTRCESFSVRNEPKWKRRVEALPPSRLSEAALTLKSLLIIGRAYQCALIETFYLLNGK